MNWADGTDPPDERQLQAGRCGEMLRHRVEAMPISSPDRPAARADFVRIPR